jgi:hypothetical protein
VSRIRGIERESQIRQFLRPLRGEDLLNQKPAERLRIAHDTEPDSLFKTERMGICTRGEKSVGCLKKKWQPRKIVRHSSVTGSVMMPARDRMKHALHRRERQVLTLKQLAQSRIIRHTDHLRRDLDLKMQIANDPA